MAKEIMRRIEAAKQDRSRHAHWINDTLRLAMPTYRQLDQTREPDARTGDQNDLFDTTLQEVIEDFASDMISTFTPRYERWVEMAPYVSLPEEVRRSIEPQLSAYADRIWDEIERSNYWDAAQECFPFWAIAGMAVAVSDMGPLEPIHFQPIEIADLLLERGADGSTTGRWREMTLTPAGLHQLWPAIFPPPTARDMLSNKSLTVYDGCDRDYSVPGVEQWTYRIIVDGKTKYEKTMQGAGAAPIIACRYRHQADSAWGPGPAHKATPRSRVLDELSYLSLKAIQKSVDPVTFYEEDGVTNIEGGLEPGTYVPMAIGTRAPTPMQVDTRFDAMIFKSDELAKGIKKALYQDRPEQPGQTPPTATQWMDEKAWNTRRRELPRDRCVREWVLPIIERVAWILKERGQLPDIKLKGGDVVNVRPISPLSKAKDLEDIQVTNQIMQLAMAVGNLKQTGAPVDVKATIENLQSTAKERHLAMMTDEQIAQEQQMAMMAQAAGAAGGA